MLLTIFVLDYYNNILSLLLIYLSLCSTGIYYITIYILLLISIDLRRNNTFLLSIGEYNLKGRGSLREIKVSAGVSVPGTVPGDVRAHSEP